jgi:hypothetical protein
MPTPGSRTGSAHRAMPPVVEQELMATRATDALCDARTSLEVSFLVIANVVRGGTRTSVSLLASSRAVTSAKSVECVSTWYDIPLVKSETNHFSHRLACASSLTMKATAMKIEQLIGIL